MAKHMTRIPDETLEGVALVGMTLGPLFRHDPVLEREHVGTLYETLAKADAQALSEEWPFVDDGKACDALAKLVDEAMRFEDVMAVDNESLAAAPKLALEYRRLFVGPAKKAAAPWGSVYTDKDQVVFGMSTLSLRDWLRANGIEVRQEGGEEPEDHIGTMLELMAWIAGNRPEVLAEYLQDHLLTWAPHFLTLMQSATTSDFFDGLAALTRESLLGIQDALGLEVEEPRFYR